MDATRNWSMVSHTMSDASTVRLAVRRFLEQSADPDVSDLDAAELIVGELVANVVRHGAPPFGVCVDWNEEIPVLYVSDRGRMHKPLIYCAPDREAERGRGLLLVRALAQGDVVVAPRNDDRSGTRVAVPLPVHRNHDLQHA